MKPQIFSLLILILGLQINCSNMCKDSVLTFQKSVNNSNVIKIDGFYYNLYNLDNQNYYNILIFYQDGQILDLSTQVVNNINELKTNLIDKNLIDKIKTNKNFHGLYLLSTNLLQIEKWYSYHTCYQKVIKDALILNDTSFIIQKTIDSEGNTNIKNDTFYYIKFSPLPDPSSSFIP